MSTLRIYADFNGLVRGPRMGREAVVLDSFGSVRDLANAGVVLTEGLPLIAVDWSDEVEDLEGHGTAEYDAANGWWVVEFDEVGVRYVPAGDRSPVTEFRCVGCSTDLSSSRVVSTPRPSGDSAVVQAFPSCPGCGLRIDHPIRPP
jgi:hypothetical protein